MSDLLGSRVESCIENASWCLDIVRVGVDDSIRCLLIRSESRFVFLFTSQCQVKPVPLLIGIGAGGGNSTFTW